MLYFEQLITAYTEIEVHTDQEVEVALMLKRIHSVHGELFFPFEHDYI